MDKYELTNETKEFEGKTLYRIKALFDFGNVKAGDLGGFIEKEDNLSHDGNAWVYDNACVYGNAVVHGNAEVYDIVTVYHDAEVFGNTKIYGNAQIYGDAKVYGNAEVYDDAVVCGNVQVYGNALIYGDAVISGSVTINSNIMIGGNASVSSAEHMLFIAPVIVPVDTYAVSLTLFRTKHFEIGVSAGRSFYTAEDFLNVINKQGDENQKSVVSAIMELARKCIDLTPAPDDLKPCPFCGGKVVYRKFTNKVFCKKCSAIVNCGAWNERA